MRLIGLSILALFFLNGCNQQTDCTDSVDQSIVEKVLRNFISEDSLETLNQATIVEYNYVKPEYADGLLIPSPPGTNNISELDIVFYVNDDNYFNLAQDTATIKEQIKNSRQRIPKLFKVTGTYDSTLPIYTFFVPIFNCNRSVAFVSYTYEQGGYWEYNGVILEQSNTKWRITKTLPLGMN